MCALSGHLGGCGGGRVAFCHATTHSLPSFPYCLSLPPVLPNSFLSLPLLFLSSSSLLDREAATYKFSAIAATVLVLSIAVVATYYRFAWHFAEDGDLPVDEMAATLLLVFGGMVREPAGGWFGHDSVLGLEWGGVGTRADG